LKFEFIAKCEKIGARIYEVPISYYGRTYEEGKKIALKDGLDAVWHIAKFNLLVALKRSCVRTFYVHFGQTERRTPNSNGELGGGMCRAHKVGKGNEAVDNSWCFGGKFLPRLAKNYA